MKWLDDWTEPGRKEMMSDEEKKKREEMKKKRDEMMSSKIAKRSDTSPKSGTRAYGNVTFADPKNKKYPIDTEAHVRAAWNYINHPKNAAKYSSSDVASIKARIKSAGKKYGIDFSEGKK